jgi:putative oxidoreductase
MGLVDRLESPVQAINKLLTQTGSPALLLFFRIYVAWVFFNSGLWKINNWEQNLAVFEYEYAVPLLHYEVAAYLATFGELVFPVFLVAGLGTRFFAIALSVINIIAVVSYYTTLAKGAGLVYHYMWGSMLLTNVVYGGGYVSFDQWIRSKFQEY